MIKNNSLSDRLNQFKHENSSVTPTENDTQNVSTINSLAEIFITIYTLIGVITRSAIMGYALNIIFTTKWNIWETLCVGLFANIIMTFISELVQRKNPPVN